MSNVSERIKKRIEARKWKITDDAFVPELIGMQYANNMNDWCLEIIDEELAKEPQECNSDLISRKKLIRDLFYSSDGNRYRTRDCDNFPITISLEDLRKVINNQPQVQQWIPCSERLPTNQTEWWHTTEYLTCGKDGTIQVLCYCDGWNCSFLNADMGVYRDNEIKDIIAWQPLPQPYTENRKES